VEPSSPPKMGEPQGHQQEKRGRGRKRRRPSDRTPTPSPAAAAPVSPAASSSQGTSSDSAGGRNVRHGGTVRVRLQFATVFGRPRCWHLVETCRTQSISSFCKALVDEYGLEANGSVVKISVSGFYMPPGSDTRLIRDGDLLVVSASNPDSKDMFRTLLNGAEMKSENAAPRRKTGTKALAQKRKETDAGGRSSQQTVSRPKKKHAGGEGKEGKPASKCRDAKLESIPPKLASRISKYLEKLLSKHGVDLPFKSIKKKFLNRFEAEMTKPMKRFLKSEIKRLAAKLAKKKTGSKEGRKGKLQGKAGSQPSKTKSRPADLPPLPSKMESMIRKQAPAGESPENSTSKKRKKRTREKTGKEKNAEAKASEDLPRVARDLGRSSAGESKGVTGADANGLVVLGSGHFSFTENENGTLVGTRAKNGSDPKIRTQKLPSAWNPHKQKLKKAIERKYREEEMQRSVQVNGKGLQNPTGENGGNLSWKAEDKDELREQIQEGMEKYGENFYAPRHLSYAGFESTIQSRREPPAADYSSYSKLVPAENASLGFIVDPDGKKSRDFYPSEGDVLAISRVELVNWTPKISPLEEVTVTRFDGDSTLTCRRANGEIFSERIGSFAEVRLIREAARRSNKKVAVAEDSSDTHEILKQLRKKRELLMSGSSS